MSSDQPPFDPEHEPVELPRAPGVVQAPSTTGAGPEHEPGERRSHEPYAALQHADFRNFALGNLVSTIGMQMLAVALSWHLYRLTKSAFALGMVGLVEIIPVVGLALFAGQVADRRSRRRIVLVTGAVIMVCVVALALVSAEEARLPTSGVLQAANVALAAVAGFFREQGLVITSPLVPVLYGVLFLIGIARAFHGPAKAALLPQLVPVEVFSNAVTWNSSFFQIAAMVGPALGGLLIAGLEGHPLQFPIVYLCSALSLVVLLATVMLVRERGAAVVHKEPADLKTLFAGIAFVRDNPIILATITLDLFAVLLGGATALLPIFADKILHVGPLGLGWLRAAPSIGALAMAMVIAHRPPMRHAGRALLVAVAGFGVATIVFGLSRNFWLSLAMLFVTGALDSISVVVRHTLVQVLTPDAMRGRVSAVNQIFIGISNELGALESGVTAALFGPVGAVMLGGSGTIVVVAMVGWLWPQVRRFGSLADAKPLEA